jgi:peptide/nickel transport system permease protein
MIEPISAEEIVPSKKRKANLSLSSLVGISLVVLLALTALVGPYFVRFTPFEQNPVNRLMGPDAVHFFGTDDFGRDVFTRTIYGLRYSLIIGAAVSAIVTVIGGTIGLIATSSSILDHLFMRFIDGMNAFPAILLSIAIVGIRGASVQNVILALVIVYTPEMARIVRSKMLSVREELYIRALVIQGAHPLRIVFHHMIPNSLSVIVVQATFIFARAVITEAALSFLGAGIPAPLPSLGNLLYDGRNVIYQAWWLTVFPGLVIILFIVGLNLAGDGLRDLMDPKIVGRRRSRAKKVEK